MLIVIDLFTGEETSSSKINVEDVEKSNKAEENKKKLWWLKYAPQPQLITIEIKKENIT